MTPVANEAVVFPVTVVTVTFNDEAGLRRTVESLRRQSLRNFEHVVVDGGSTDQSMVWLAAHPAVDASLFLSEGDDGIYDAMNKGLSLARGMLITFLNSGDVYAREDVLARAVTHHERYGWQWGHGLARVVDAQSRAVRPLGKPHFRRWHHAFGRNDIIHQTMFVSTDRLQALGGFDLRFPIAADFHSILQLARLGRPGLWPEIDVEFLVGGLSDRRPGRSLWDMHRARCDVFQLSGPVALLDAVWCAGLTLYVFARRMAKRAAGLVWGQRAVDWWARQ